jgi:hypothetical protein
MHISDKAAGGLKLKATLQQEKGRAPYNLTQCKSSKCGGKVATSHCVNKNDVRCDKKLSTVSLLCIIVLTYSRYRIL